MNQKQLNILLVDDDPINNRIVEQMVKRFGDGVNFAAVTDGLKGLDYLSESLSRKLPYPDLVFLDLQMPFLNGWEFLDVFERINYQRQLAVYILSSSTDAADLAKAKEYKCLKGFLHKPLSATKITEVLNALSGEQ